MTTRSLALGPELRRLRKAASLTLDQVAASIEGLTRATLQRWETGSYSPTSVQLDALLTTYGASPSDVAYLLRLMGGVDSDRWWATENLPLIDQMRAWISLEQSATDIYDWALGPVPGLLQTPNYARRLIKLGDAEDVAALVEARLARQDLLWGRVRYHAILDESVLLRRVGTARMMVEQIDALAQQAELSNIDIRILRFTAGEHLGLNGSFSMLAVPDGGFVVQTEQHGYAALHTEPHPDTGVRASWDQLDSLAAPVAETATILAQHREVHRAAVEEVE